MSGPASPVNDGLVEIRMSLDSVDPLVGRRRVLSGPGSGAAAELRFAGWLSLLRVLSEVTGAPADGPAGGK